MIVLSFQCSRSLICGSIGRKPRLAKPLATLLPKELDEIVENLHSHAFGVEITVHTQYKQFSQAGSSRRLVRA